MICFYIPRPGRKAYVGAGNKCKVAVAIGADYAIFLGNESDQELTVAASEMFGFNTGEYEQKLVTGDSKST